jgi:ABC-type Na+ efflux pump permease subunit
VTDAVTTASGLARYEFAMQFRRRAVWFGLGLLALLLAAGRVGGFGVVSTDDPTLPQAVARWSVAVQLLLPVAFGLLLADRIPRDRRLRIDELAAATPASTGVRLLAKFAGATLATLVPTAAIYGVGVAYLAATEGRPAAIPLAAAAFATINLPGLLFVAAFSVACPAVLWVPLYQFLFVGYWFWGNLLPPDGAVPTLSGTWLTPIGGYALGGLWYDQYPAWEGVASIGLLLIAAALALVAANLYLRRLARTA